MIRGLRSRHADLFALVDERGNLHHQTSLGLGGFGYVRNGCALDAGLGFDHRHIDGGGQLHADRPRRLCVPRRFRHRAVRGARTERPFRQGGHDRTARSALAEVRETIGGYRARGLAAEMDAARNALTAAGVRLEVDGLPVPGTLRPAEETVMALALREAVTNVVRHAQATTCRLRFTVQDGRHSLVIQDDGQHTALHEGNGLRGMRERVELLGGKFQLEREHGTRLLIELPATAGSVS